MNKKLLCAALAALAALAAVPAIASADTDPAQWDVYTQAGNVRDHRTFKPDTSYSMRSTTVGQLVGGDSRADFAKLGVATQWRFVRQNGRDHRSFRNGETVAIYSAGYDGYMIDRGTTSGRAIAAFVRTPKYVWTVERKPGNIISFYVKTTGTERKYLVADSSSGKPELHWYKTGTPTPEPPTCSSGFTPGSLHRDVVWATAQPAVNGYANYRATLGAGKCGQLNLIINNSNQTIGILKKGHTTAECGDPNALAYVGVYDSISPGSLGLGNGTTPMLPVDISICGYGDPSGSLRMVYEWYAN
jgi:hypothetical protein